MGKSTPGLFAQKPINSHQTSYWLVGHENVKMIKTDNNGDGTSPKIKVIPWYSIESPSVLQGLAVLKALCNYPELALTVHEQELKREFIERLSEYVYNTHVKEITDDDREASIFLSLLMYVAALTYIVAIIMIWDRIDCIHKIGIILLIIYTTLTARSTILMIHYRSKFRSLKKDRNTVPSQ